MTHKTQKAKFTPASPSFTAQPNLPAEYLQKNTLWVLHVGKELASMLTILGEQRGEKEAEGMLQQPPCLPSPTLPHIMVMIKHNLSKSKGQELFSHYSTSC